MALSKKSKTRLLFNEIYKHPLLMAQTMVNVKKAKDIELLIIKHCVMKELKKRGY